MPLPFRSRKPSARGAAPVDHEPEAEPGALEEFDPEEWVPRFSAAGLDSRVGDVVPGVEAGQWQLMRTLLRRSTAAQRISRTRILGRHIAWRDSPAAQYWLSEEPESPDAQALAARTAVAHVRRMSAEDHGVPVGVVERACRSIDRASASCPGDPVPLLCELELAEVLGPGRCPSGRRGRWKAEAPDLMWDEGPWPVLHELDARVPGSAEAYLRMLGYLSAHRGATAALWARACADRAEAGDGSVLHLLPVHQRTSYRIRDRQPLTVIDSQVAEGIDAELMAAFDNWFVPQARRHGRLGPEWSLRDLSLLAFGLSMGGLYQQAWAVWSVHLPYAHPEPWTQAFGPSGLATMQTNMRWACNAALKAASEPSPLLPPPEAPVLPDGPWPASSPPPYPAQHPAPHPAPYPPQYRAPYPEP